MSVEGVGGIQKGFRVAKPWPPRRAAIETILIRPVDVRGTDRDRFIHYLINKPHTYMKIIGHIDRLPYSMEM